MKSRKKTTVACVCCGQTGPHSARGLIDPCYKRHRDNGTLDQFKKRAETQVAPDQALVPLGVLGALLIAAPTELEEWVEDEIGHEIVTRAISTAKASSLLAVSA